MTTSHSPNISILELLKQLKNLNNWKIVIISEDDKIDKNWKLLECKELVYLSLKDQIYLGFKITKFLKDNSYARRNIGYLYAIQNGAKEIYEIDEDIIISDLNHLTRNLNNIFIGYGLRNDSRMINPFYFYGEANIWPRGFRIKDIGNNEDSKYYILNSSKLNIKPLIFQGLINGIPDVDSILIQTRIKKNNLINFKFSNNFPLLYLPGNYVPINSKNTRYLYEIFPYLLLPSSLNERICDIFRGYIMQKFAWSNNGGVIYYFTSLYHNKSLNLKNLHFFEEKDLYYKLDNFLDELNIKLNSKNKYPTNFLDFIKILVDKGFLNMNDLKLYKAFIKDLLNIKYNFSYQNSEKCFYEYKKIFNIYSQFKYYLPYNHNIILNNNDNKRMIKIKNHYALNKSFTDILLIINFNHIGFENLNEYLLKLYSPFFPKILFITPNKSNISNEINIISCNESFYGYYSYICFKKVYEKYSNYKGYLFINDDLFMKVWELDNFDFNIPWLYIFSPIYKRWMHYIDCINIYKVIDTYSYWKRNIINFTGYDSIPFTMSDFYYIPNFMAIEFFDIMEKMFHLKIFLECAVPTAMGIILYNKYQLINIRPLWGKQRNNVINHLQTNYDEITIHPIKFSNKINQEEVNKYIFFMNAKEF